MPLYADIEAFKVQTDVDRWPLCVPILYAGLVSTAGEALLFTSHIF